MIAFRKGTTRRVLVIWPFAFKFARRFHGKACNLYEADCYRTSTPRNRENLCPVVWCSPKGLLLIQRSARPLTRAEQQERLKSVNGFPDWDYMPGGPEGPFEHKESDWGWYKGRLVALDYSTPAIAEGEASSKTLERERGGGNGTEPDWCVRTPLESPHLTGAKHLSTILGLYIGKISIIIPLKPLPRGLVTCRVRLMLNC